MPSNLPYLSGLRRLHFLSEEPYPLENSPAHGVLKISPCINQTQWVLGLPELLPSFQ